MGRKRKPQKKMDQVAEQLLEKIGQAVEELNVQVVTEVRKEKELFYENEDMPAKVTREVTCETQTLTRVDAPVDRAGIKQLVNALKEVQSLSQEEGDNARALEVVLEGALKEYAQ